MIKIRDFKVLLILLIITSLFIIFLNGPFPYLILVKPAAGQKVFMLGSLLAGSMAMIVISKSSILLLISEDDSPEVRKSSCVYLIAMFALLYKTADSFTLGNSRSTITVHDPGLRMIYIMTVLAILSTVITHICLRSYCNNNNFIYI